MISVFFVSTATGPPRQANGWRDAIRGISCAWNRELTQVSDILLAGLAGNPKPSESSSTGDSADAL
jgi:hypothetical protein